MATYLEQSLTQLEEFEGSIPWMYRDTVGRVTVAVGLMLPDSQAASKLPFQLGGRAATQAEIAEEYARVDTLPMGRPAMFYRREAGLELAKVEIDKLLRKVLTGFEEELRAKIPGYDAMPDGVKLALLDMAYNLGPVGLVHGFPRLMKAVATGAWAQAAAVCSRRGPGAARNEWTRAMFLASVIGQIKAEREGALRRLGYGVMGAIAAMVAAVRHRLRG